MTAIPLLSGVGTNPNADFVQHYPINLEPVSLDTGFSKGFVRMAPGATVFGVGPGLDRGGINWNGVCYRVMGTKLVSVSSTGIVSILGDVGSGGPVEMDYGFGMLAINSGTRLYYWNGMTLTQVTDPDLGQVLDVLWMSGYYITTDGNSIVVTDLANPLSVNPLKYGSAEDDPDQVVGLFKLRGELYALGQYTIQPFQEIGGTLFPFQAIPTATIPVGCVGARAKCSFFQTMAFVGSGRDEATAVYLLNGGTAEKISTRAIDDELAAVLDQTSITMESRTSRDERRLVINLPNKSLIYCAMASRTAGEPVWYIAASGLRMDEAYRLQNAVYCYNKWICGDTVSGNIGVLDDGLSTHYGELTGWQLDTLLIYNGGADGILHEVELVGTPGRGPSGSQTQAFLSTTFDGETYSMERACSTGLRGRRGTRVRWTPHRRFEHYMGLRFRGAGDAVNAWTLCEARIEPLA